ncbi:MAG TPA: glycosyltransferase family 2 protein [Nitrosomonas mobilis]|uniref:Glycosyl transferase family 2 n=1 Tax=Nitrosomonas mobilis TaxID=51642 RepID=A0A1G5SE07_9PROT|nr:Glycosyl transferase family 2 [Nitrosomonas mobilis]HNO75134.1 glycosyltransferase family 2 protein [Nitrosomonas mobilis]
MNYQVPITALIVNYNAGELLVDCALALSTQVGQIIVVDNASTDTSIVRLKDAFFGDGQLNIISLQKNVGFAAGCNLGLSAVVFPYILFINPDCLISSDAVERLRQVIESDRRTGMVGGRLLNADGSEQGGSRRAIPTPWRAFVRATGLYRFARFFPTLFFDFHLHHQPLPDQPIEVEAISGALMLVRRQAIDAVGIWDEGYFLHCEDLDWCMRFRQKNWKILFVPDVPVLHHQGACSHARPFFVAWHKHRGMLRFYRKFFLHRYPVGLTWLVAIGITMRFSVIVLYHVGVSLLKSTGLHRG